MPRDELKPNGFRRPKDVKLLGPAAPTIASDDLASVKAVAMELSKALHQLAKTLAPTAHVEIHAGMKDGQAYVRVEIPRGATIVERALLAAEQAAGPTAAEHKQWCLDQVVRVLTDRGYWPWLSAHPTWSVGVAPPTG